MTNINKNNAFTVKYIIDDKPNKNTRTYNIYLWCPKKFWLIILKGL